MSRSAAAPAVHEHDRPRLRPRAHGVPSARRISGPAHPAHPADPGRLAHSASAQPARSSGARPAAMSSDTVLVPPLPRAQPRERQRARAPQRPPQRLAAGGAAIALRVADRAIEVSGSRAMDRVVRSQAWIVIVGIGLIGIVAMQVSLLKLNSGIGRAVETVATLERSNATLKADISALSSGDRIQALAGQKGYSMPQPADVTYLRAGDLRSDGFRAARRMRAPDPSITGPAGAATAASLSAALTGEAPAGPATTIVAPDTGAGTAPVPTPAPATATPSPTATTTPPAGTTAPVTAPPATNGAAATPPAVAAIPPTGTTATVAPQPTSSGGVTLP